MLTELTRLRDTNMRTKEDQDVAVLWDVVREGEEPGLSNERDAGQTAHREGAAAPKLRHDKGQRGLFVVDLVRADGVRVDRV